MRGREKFARVEPALVRLASVAGHLPLSVRRRLLTWVRGAGGPVGMASRYVLLRSLGCTSDPNVSVREDVYLFNTQGLRIGRNVSVHPMSYLDAIGGIDIGDDVSIAHAVSILSSSHVFSDLTRPINDQGVTLARTTVSDNCWLGAQVVVVAGVTIGSGCVVAANSVVTTDVPANSVVAGSPARVIGSRT